MFEVGAGHAGFLRLGPQLCELEAAAHLLASGNTELSHASLIVTLEISCVRAGAAAAAAAANH